MGPEHGIDTTPPLFDRLADTTIQQLIATRGLTATVSDILDRMGWSLVVPATILTSRQDEPSAIVGHAITSAYLPMRQPSAASGSEGSGGSRPPPLAFNPGHETGQPGDVLVLSANGMSDVSVFGGRVARAARRSGMSGVIVDGAFRDLDELRASGMPAWSRGLTPRTGRGRLEQASLNKPIHCAGVQVHPGDLVVADVSGVCFVPAEIAAEVAERALEVAAKELEAEAKGID